MNKITHEFKIYTTTKYDGAYIMRSQKASYKIQKVKRKELMNKRISRNSDNSAKN